MTKRFFRACAAFFLFSLCFLFALCSPCLVFAGTPADQQIKLKEVSRKSVATKQSIHDFEAELITGELQSLSDYSGKVLLITNIALHCGTTHQLTALQALHSEFHDKGLQILAFPSNDFSAEEMGNSDIVKTRCKREYGVEFTLFSPVKVIGEEKHPVFAFLTESGNKKIRGEVGFNFEKFLVDKNGKVRERFGPFTGAQSDSIKRHVQALIDEL